MTQHELIENLAYKIDENYNEATILGETINIEWLKNVIRKTMTKSHADWLRSEIEKLEGMEKDFEVQSDGQYHFGENQKVIGFNQALTSIITRYKEELKVLESK